VEFDLLGLTGGLQFGTSLVNINAFYNSGVLRWYFHQNVPWLQLALTLFPSGIAPTGFTTEVTSTIFANGVQQLNNFFNMCDHNRMARHILPQETFRAEIVHPTAFTAAGVDVYYVIQMLGILYAAL